MGWIDTVAAKFNQEEAMTIGLIPYETRMKPMC